MSKATPEIILAKSIPEPNTGCWLWLGAVTSGGYGTLYLDGRTASAHRTAYEAFVSPIPDSLEIDHLCRVRSCVNPRHLEPVTRRENGRRGHGLIRRNSAATECPRGHPYTTENTRLYAGRRFCRMCRREKSRAYHREPKNRPRINARKRRARRGEVSHGAA